MDVLYRMIDIAMSHSRIDILGVMAAKRRWFLYTTVPFVTLIAKEDLFDVSTAGDGRT